MPIHLNVDDVAWEPHPRFAGLQVKLIESKATHPHLSVMLVKVDPGGEIPLHTHAVETETAYILGGAGTLFVDDAPYPLATGINATIPVGSPHRVTNDSDAPLLIYAIHTPPLR